MPQFKITPDCHTKIPVSNCCVFLKLSIISIVIFSLSACLPSKQPALKIDYYTLDYDAPKASHSKNKLPVILTIERFSSSPEYRTDKMIYQEKKATLSNYTYHRWRAVPADIVTYYLSRDLQSLGSFQAVTSPTGRLTPTHRVEGVVDKFLEIDGDEYWQAVISITITLTKESEPDVSRQVLAQQSYTSQIRCESKHPLAVSMAMATGMAEISRKVDQLLVEKLQ